MTTDFIANQWGSADRAADPSRFVRYLDTVGSLKTMQCIKQRTYDLLDIEEGDQLLDVGCGTGDDVRALARNVGPTGHVVGIDGSERMVAEARIRAKEANLPVEFRVGNAERLEFADSVFDGCRAERLLIHLKNPERALAELVRVTRPGARIVVFDADWETLIIDAPHRGTTRKILDFHCDSIRSVWLSRHGAVLPQPRPWSAVSGPGAREGITAASFCTNGPARPTFTPRCLDHVRTAENLPRFDG